MTQHIIDTDELEKVLNKYEGTNGWASALCDDLRALIASPQADANTPPDVYDIAVDTGDGIYHTAEVVHFQQSGSKRMIQVKIGEPEPQSDDMRKDAERWRTFREIASEEMCYALCGNSNADNDELDQAVDKIRE